MLPLGVARGQSEPLLAPLAPTLTLLPPAAAPADKPFPPTGPSLGWEGSEGPGTGDATPPPEPPPDAAPAWWTDDKDEGSNTLPGGIASWPETPPRSANPGAPPWPCAAAPADPSTAAPPGPTAPARKLSPGGDDGWFALGTLGETTPWGNEFLPAPPGGTPDDDGGGGGGFACFRSRRGTSGCRSRSRYPR